MRSTKTSLTLINRIYHKCISRGTLKFVYRHIIWLVGWELAKDTTFIYKKNFVPRTHVLVQIFVNFGMNFFGGKLNEDVTRVVDENKTKQHIRYTERRSDNFHRSQDESQSDGKMYPSARAGQQSIIDNITHNVATGTKHTACSMEHSLLFRFTWATRRPAALLFTPTVLYYCLLFRTL